MGRWVGKVRAVRGVARDTHHTFAWRVLWFVLSLAAGFGVITPMGGSLTESAHVQHTPILNVGVGWW